MRALIVELGDHSAPIRFDGVEGRLFLRDEDELHTELRGLRASEPDECVLGAPAGPTTTALRCLRRL